MLFKVNFGTDMKHICWYMRGERFYKSLSFKTFQALSRTGRMLSCRQYTVFFPKSVAVIWCCTLAPFSPFQHAGGWNTCRAFQASATPLVPLHLQRGHQLGEAALLILFPGGSFPLSDNETSPCGCGGAEIERRTTARTYSSSDHHATPVWLIFLRLQTSNIVQEIRTKRRNLFLQMNPLNIWI